MGRSLSDSSFTTAMESNLTIASTTCLFANRMGNTTSVITLRKRAHVADMLGDWEKENQNLLNIAQRLRRHIAEKLNRRNTVPKSRQALKSCLERPMVKYFQDLLRSKFITR